MNSSDYLTDSDPKSASSRNMSSKHLDLPGSHREALFKVLPNLFREAVKE